MRVPSLFLLPVLAVTISASAIRRGNGRFPVLPAKRQTQVDKATIPVFDFHPGSTVPVAGTTSAAASSKPAASSNPVASSTAVAPTDPASDTGTIPAFVS
ncbi:Uu.00g062050.m01.CDS01 [Anthostomella pinea]|uniref:Uu.00g062050.m01.CDS01 n=1 Tax=Anthostomella pinea TaxID=933095 RepID=A0AAI8YMW8_9PEZI|nr:Uu.00g062050.m01.CDS01 [Anthostomella pinea]